MFLAHVVHCLAPWYEAIEQSIDVNLLTEKDDRDGIYAKFTEEGLLRGSIKDTSEVLDKYVNGGLMTPNEGRAKLELDADSDPASDKLRIPANIVGKNPNDPAADSEVVGSPAKPKPVPQGGAVVVQDDQAKGFNMLDLAKAMEVAFSKVSINVQPAQIKVDVAQPAIHVTTPDVTFNAPAINIAPAAVTVNIPEQQPHVVNAPVTVNLPEQQAPVVNIAATEINVQPAEVSVTTPVVQVAPPQVNVTVEKGGEVRFTEDDEGNITGAVMQ
jgi:phage baseplate assembly protein gpV